MSKQHKRSGHKHKRTERKDKRSRHKRSGHNKAYRKGSKSKTMKGKKDFTTKKTSKVFNRRKHYQKHAKGSRVIRRPYAKKGGLWGCGPDTGVGCLLGHIGAAKKNSQGKWVMTASGVAQQRAFNDGSDRQSPQASASTKTSSRVKSSNPVIVKTKQGAYVVDGKAGAVSGN